MTTAPVAQPPVDTNGDLPIGLHTFEFLCGTAGTGKTTLAKRLMAERDGVELAATTGIAAVNLGEGTTINALLRYFNLQSLRDGYRNGHIQASLRRLRRAGLRRILLDEVSMLSGEALTLLTRAIMEVNSGEIAQGLDEAMAEGDAGDGGADSAQATKPLPPPIGLTLVGDFGQLPPVPDEDPAMPGKKLPVVFAFESSLWSVYAEHTVKLTKIWRQENVPFINALQAVRMGDFVTALQFFTPEKFHQFTDEQFQGTTVFAKNADVDRHNQLMLDKLVGEKMTAQAVRGGVQRGDWKQIPDVLHLKVGALVMILANKRIYDGQDDERGRMIYANGSLGHVVGKAPGMDAWTVKLLNGSTVPVEYVLRENLIPLEPGRKAEIRAEGAAHALKQCQAWQTDGRQLHQTPDWNNQEDLDDMDAIGVPVWCETDEEFRWTIEHADASASYVRSKITEDGKYEIIGTVHYMPLRAAYGCTVHKTQGLTLDAVQINIRDRFFETPGMLFVALSRCRTAEGLRIVGTQKGFVERCKISPKVQPWL